MQERRITQKCQWSEAPWAVGASGGDACPALGVRWVNDTIPSLTLCPKHLQQYEDSKLGTLVDLRRLLA